MDKGGGAEKGGGAAIKLYRNTVIMTRGIPGSPRWSVGMRSREEGVGDGKLSSERTFKLLPYTGTLLYRVLPLEGPIIEFHHFKRNSTENQYQSECAQVRIARHECDRCTPHAKKRHARQISFHVLLLTGFVY